MPYWSSPHPLPAETLQLLDAVDFHQKLFPDQSADLLLFNSPDQVLLSKRRHGISISDALQQFDQSCHELLKCKRSDSGNVLACWDLAAFLQRSPTPAPALDGLMIVLIEQLLEAKEDYLQIYLELDPAYIDRLKQHKPLPTQLLEQKISEALRIESLLEQQIDFQRRALRLLTGLQAKHLTASPRSDG